MIKSINLVFSFVLAITLLRGNCYKKVSHRRILVRHLLLDTSVSKKIEKNWINVGLKFELLLAILGLFYRLFSVFFNKQTSWQFFQQKCEKFLSSIRHRLDQGLHPPNICDNVTSMKFLSKLGGSPGQVAMGGDSCSKGHGFESGHCILHGHSSHLFAVKIVMMLFKKT